MPLQKSDIETLWKDPFEITNASKCVHECRKSLHGLSVRAVLERGVPVQIVEGAANIANANADQSMGESGRADEVDEYEMMIEAHGQQHEVVVEQDEYAADDDLSHISLEDVTRMHSRS